VTIGAAFPEVLAAAKAGGEWAWEQLFASVERPLRGYLRAQGAADPEDMAGDVLLATVSGIPAFDGDERQFRSWIFVIAHHRLVDERRRNRRREQVTRLAPPCEQIADAGAEVLARLDGSEWTERLARLSEDQRTVVLLRVVGGLTTEETATVVGKRPGAVRVMQHRALGRLRGILSAEVTK
jgi:RNA polymerase sigma factor (sigma-70 family)